MIPSRDTQATLVDLLDRVLDKGLVLDADIIIGLSGVPLLGIKLRAALAGVETMLRYGLWSDWAEAQRADTGSEARKENAVCT
ncbi:MAG: gas vesicle protein [Chloroflexi bacterium]|nr:gas vesicle protein [Chloroflexota bacterium]